MRLFFTFLLAALPLRAEILLRGAIHVHSERSFDSKGTFEEIEKAAREAGLDFVILTDHVASKKTGANVPLPLSSSDLLWIDGVEVEIAKKQHVLLFGHAVSEVRWETGRGLEGLRAAKEKGALLFLDHYLGRSAWKTLPFDGIALYNTHEDTLYPRSQLLKLLFLAVTDRQGLDRLWTSLLDPPQREIKVWERLSQNTPLPIVASNDAHQNIRLLGRQMDPYSMSFRFVSTYVLAREKSEKAVLEALRRNQSYIAFPILGDPKGFSFAEAAGSVRAALPPGASGKIGVFHNGDLVWETEASAVSIPKPQPGNWRCEVWIKKDSKWKPWIYSNMIHIP